MQCQHYWFRFSFFSLEHNPAHVHISKGDAKAKFNLLDGTIMENKGMKPKDLKEPITIANENKEMFLEKWNLNFNQ